MKAAFENGINMFDTAEAYNSGKSEEEMYACLSQSRSGILLLMKKLPCRGRVIKELGWRRSDLVITTKLFWGTRPGPNSSGLSRKQYALLFLCIFFLFLSLILALSIVEGTQESLARLQLDYVDVIFAHR